MIAVLKASDVMTRDVIAISQDSTLAEAIQWLIDKKISGMPVIDKQGKLVGIISEKDILNFAFSGNLRNTQVREAMTREIKSFSPDVDVEQIALAISQHHFRRVPILEGEKIVGIVSRRDIIRVALLNQK